MTSILGYFATGANFNRHNNLHLLLSANRSASKGGADVRLFGSYPMLATMYHAVSRNVKHILVSIDILEATITHHVIIHIIISPKIPKIPRLLRD